MQILRTGVSILNIRTSQGRSEQPLMLNFGGMTADGSTLLLNSSLSSRADMEKQDTVLVVP